MSKSGRILARRRNRVRPRRLILEPLEDRALLAAVITVNSVLDTNARDSVLTLREAILISNRTLALGSLTVAEQAQVLGTPTANDADTIGFNIPGSDVHTIDLTSALPSLTAPVTIDGYTEPGASANTSGPKTAGNAVLLIELNGTSAGNSTGLVLDGADDSLIRGLVINRFAQGAIWILKGNRNRLEGNYIGTDPSGTAARPNKQFGINIAATIISDSSADNVIGGANPAARNLISGNQPSIAGNFASGIHLNGSTGGNHFITGTIIQGNFIGTDVTGTLALPNSIGINFFDNTSGTQIGGSGVGEGNLVSGNQFDGIEVGGRQTACTSATGSFSNSTGNLIRGNRIGTDASGTQALGNGTNGITVGFQSASFHVIGGTEPNEGNIIAFNGLNGVGLLNSHTAVLGNSIFSNSKLGIDLGLGCSVTANDVDDADTSSPNNRQNFPEMTSATLLNGPAVAIGYKVPSSTANSAYPLRVEFFEGDASGAEGQTLLSFDTYEAFEAGQTKTATFPLAVALSSGSKIVATATDADGNTSEFSASIVVRCSTVVVNTADAGAGSLRDAITCANATPGTDTISFNIPGDGVHSIRPLTALPAITDAVIIDGYTQPGASPNTNGPGLADNAVLRIQIYGNPDIAAGGGVGSPSLRIDASHSTVKGLAINGKYNNFLGHEISLFGDDNVIAGNFVGTDATGSFRVGGTGIYVLGKNNQIGDIVASARNVISGNSDGIIAQSSATGLVIQGNFIGTDATGKKAIPNDFGIDLNSSATVGGTVVEAGNLISGNTYRGIFLSDTIFDVSELNTIQSNFIGTDVTGTGNLGNGGPGIYMANSSHNRIEHNTIAFNSPGIVMIASFGAATDNFLSENSIYANSGLGIDLNYNGVTVNDNNSDADTGPNNLQNFPEFAYVTRNVGKLKVTYNVPSAPTNATYPIRVELFLADATGQGQTYLGFDAFSETDFQAGGKTVTLDAAAPAVSEKIVATATDSLENTSEFSAATVIASPWLNPAHRVDARQRYNVNADPAIAADDALEVINYINAKGSGKVPDNAANAKPYYDVTGDNSVAADDVLAVINYLNSKTTAEGEPVSANAADDYSAVDEVMTLLAMDAAGQQPRRRK